MTDRDIITLREYIESLIAAERERVDTLLKANREALELQAREYERRLAALNHAHEKAIAVQHTYVTQDKWEDRVASESAARETALLRIDEKFTDYVKRYEQRQREVDQALTTQKASAETARRFAEDTAAKANRNIAILGIVLAAFVVVMNLLGLG